MRIKRLVIPAYKNLKDLSLEFSAEHMTTALIGQNATGKSNVIEALVEIFRHLDLGEEPSSALRGYQLAYLCRGHDVEIKSTDGNVLINVRENGSDDSKKLSVSEISQRAEQYLPRNVFAYYSGRNERLQELFYEHQRRHYLKLRGEFVETEEGNRGFSSEDPLLRRLFYFRNEHSQLILLAYLVELERQTRKGESRAVEEEVELLRKYLSIKSEGIESVLFVLRKPRAVPSTDSEIDTEETEVEEEVGDERFWNATGVIAEFLSVLWKHALAPIGTELRKQTDFRGHTQKQDTLYLYLDKDRLVAAAEEVGDVNVFFRQLEGVYMADYLDEVRIQLHRVGVDRPLFFKELSEGEQQLMSVLGLLRFSRDDESLFLLDEPDTHLNPIWKYNYFRMIDDVLGKDESRKAMNQLLLTTHDPLMLGSLLRAQVRVLSQEGDCVRAETPYQDPRGMGFTGLLRSEMFGLRSTIDPKTLEDLDERNSLLAKKAKEEQLSSSSEARLEELRKHLDGLGFGLDERDPLYQLFLERLYEHRRKPLTEVLTPEQLDAQTRLADKIVRELVQKDKLDELSEFAKELRIELEK